MGFLSQLFSCICLNKTSTPERLRGRGDKRRRYAESPSSPPRYANSPQPPSTPWPTDSPSLSMPEPLSTPSLTTSHPVSSQPGSSGPASHMPPDEEGNFGLRGSSSRSGRKSRRTQIPEPGRRSDVQVRPHHTFMLRKSKSVSSSSVPPAPPSDLPIIFSRRETFYGEAYQSHPGGDYESGEFPSGYNFLFPPHHDEDED